MTPNVKDVSDVLEKTSLSKPIQNVILLVIIFFALVGSCWWFYHEYMQKYLNKTVTIEVSYRNYHEKPNGLLFADGKECKNKNKGASLTDRFECSVPSIGEYRCQYKSGKHLLFDKDLNTSKDFEEIVVDKKLFDIVDFRCSLNNSNMFNGKFKLRDIDGDRLYGASSNIKLKVCDENITNFRIKDDKSVEFNIAWQKFQAMYYDNCKEAINIDIEENSLLMNKPVEKRYFFSGEKLPFVRDDFVKYGNEQIKFIRTRSNGAVELFSSKQNIDYVLHFNICKLENNTTMRVFFDDDHVDIDRMQIGFNGENYKPLEFYREIKPTNENPIQVTVTKTNKNVHLKLIYDKKQLNGNGGDDFNIKKSSLKLGFFSEIKDKKVAIIVSDIVTSSNKRQ